MVSSQIGTQQQDRQQLIGETRNLYLMVYAVSPSLVAMLPNINIIQLRFSLLQAVP